ncbi:outer membrane protein [Rugamonas sp. DEMB1]|uniref:outer membrane protein n=1 Tax=Rugamonas sp. DEMB1 TaxID=3039386 RepID=UPI00244BEB5E|nr:outer membrane beta-barrel protein [Rugamonas sp. DEMB1]WGG50229.1 outer membrane beta-barrel protein [Rugamonas sp. DEMB1]
MSSMSIRLSAGLLAGAALLAAGAAGAADLSPGYVGVDIGLRNHYSLDCLAGNACDKNANRSGKLYAGYTLATGQLLGRDTTHAVELSVYNGGTATGAFKNGSGVLQQGEGKLAGVGVASAGSIKLNEEWALTTRLGVVYQRGKVNYLNYAPNTSVGSDVKNQFALTAGWGLAYALDKNWSLKADWNYLPVKFGKAESSNLNTFSVGAAYHF